MLCFWMSLTIIIKSIDRLGRNYSGILEQWRKITKEKSVFIFVIDMSLLDTRQKERDLTGTLITDVILQLLSYVAQTERELIRQRQAEGVAAAQARGVKLGRPVLPTPENFREIVELFELHKITLEDALKQTSLKKTTFFNRAKRLKSETTT